MLQAQRRCIDLYASVACKGSSAHLELLAGNLQALAYIHSKSRGRSTSVGKPDFRAAFLVKLRAIFDVHFLLGIEDKTRSPRSLFETEL